MNKNIAIIQGRMGSERFPGKTMFQLAGKPSIAHLLDATRRVFANEDIIIATSVKTADDAIAEFCSVEGIECFRGDESNVAGRFFDVAKERNADYFVRLNADSPLLDFRVITKVLESAYEYPYADVVSTSVFRTFPSGTNVEVVKSATFIREYSNFSKPEHFEHVTKYFYENVEKFKIISVKSEIEHPECYKFSFDTLEDGERIVKIFDLVQKPHSEYTLKEKCALYDDLFNKK